MARRGLAASLRAWGKAHTMLLELMPPAKTDQELACQLKVEEPVVEEAHQGRDVATLEVVMEAARLLRCE